MSAYDVNAKSEAALRRSLVTPEGIDLNLLPLCPHHQGCGLGPAGRQQYQGDKVFHSLSLAQFG